MVGATSTTPAQVAAIDRHVDVWPGSTSPRRGQWSGIEDRSLAWRVGTYDMAIGSEVGQSSADLTA